MVTYSKDELLIAVNKSKNLTETLRNLNMCTTGGSRKYIKKYIELWNIDISHFLTTEEMSKLCSSNLHHDPIPLDLILVENGTYNRNRLKNRLYKSGLKQRFCEMCGQGENWKTGKISMIMDHINGINDDNRLENLRILCPNCNATLPTHCGKNLKTKK